MSVQVIPISNEYRVGYDKVVWEKDRKVKEEVCRENEKKSKS